MKYIIFCKPEWLKQAKNFAKISATKHPIVFIDEFNIYRKDVLQASIELVLSKKSKKKDKNQ